jgi:hypothetical protein
VARCWVRLGALYEFSCVFLRASSRIHINFNHIYELELICWLLQPEDLLYLEKQKNCFMMYVEFLMWVLRFERSLVLKLFQCFELDYGYNLIMLCMLKWWACLSVCCG